MSLLAQLTSGSFPTDRTEFFRAHIRPDGRPWSFDGHEYLAAIVADNSRDIVLRKAAQLGLSTLAMGIALHDMTQGRKVGYYLSDRTFMQAFIQDRFNPLVNADNELAGAVMEGKPTEGDAATARARRKSADNLRLMHLGSGSAWFQGLQSLRDAKSITLDTIIKDELDELDPKLVTWLDDRMLHSTYKHTMALSQPSVPGIGIDAEFEASDQKYFLLKCRWCHRWCNLIEDWPDCLIEHHPGASDAEPRIVCRKCGRRISIAQSEAYEWVAKHPGQSTSGYALSQLYGPHCDASEVARRLAKAQKSPSAMESLTISIVGKPYAGDKQPLSEDVISKACRDWPVGPPAVLNDVIPEALRRRPLRIAGIDQGKTLHAMIAQEDPDKRLLVFDIKVFAGGDPWADLEAWLKANEATFFVVDAGPETNAATRLVRTPGLHGAKCYFQESKDLRVQILEPEHQLPMKAVTMERNAAIDEAAGAVIAGDVLLPSPKHDIINLVKAHCSKLAKKPNPSTGRLEYMKNVENHLGLALTYLHLAGRVCEMLHIGPAEEFGPPSSHLLGATIAPSRGMVY